MTRYSWRANIKRETKDSLDQLSVGLGFIIPPGSGRYSGDPSPTKMLDTLAAAYRANPERVLAALRSAGVTGPGLPAAD